MKAHLFKRWDIPVYLLVALLATALLLTGIGGDKGNLICVSVGDSESYYSLDSDKTVLLEGNGIRLTLKIENGEAYVLHSECKDGVCVSSGKIHKNGQIIVCAPAGISIKVVGKGGDYDAITG